MEERIGLVRAAMIAYFGGDRRRIDHALDVARYAKEILATEPGAREVVLAAALLHDIGIPEAERKYGSAAGHLQEEEGPPVARRILTEIGFPEGVISEVCEIIGSHHSPGEVETANFRIIWDSDWLVNISDECDIADVEKVREMVSRVFMTPSGRRVAESLFL